jgi:cytoskeletal protein RodZ
MQSTNRNISQDTGRCAKCDASFLNDAKFCNNCGERIPANINPTEVASHKGNSIISSVMRLIAFCFGAAIVHVIFFSGSAMPKTLNNDNSSYAVPSLIDETVSSLKKQTTLPKKIDDSTTLVDVTAEPNAIRYHYILSGLDLSEQTNSDFKNVLAPDLCSNKDTRKLLDHNINMEYSYIVQETNKSFFASISKSDCPS